jgi:hypothetical protein
MVQQAVRAWQLIKAIKAQDIELLYGLPDWAISATMSQQVFMTDEDEYTGLWISYPLETEEMTIEVFGLPEGVDKVDSIAFRAQPRDVLVYRGEGMITVLTERKPRGWQ